MSQPLRQTHLEFYRQHQISPVRYDLSSIDAHLERRFSLYAKLGLPPLVFKEAKVLEVAAGTGHNSLYVAQLQPRQLILLEPNEKAIEYIHKAYATFNKPHTRPEIICKPIQEYSPDASFDIAICENWLGSSLQELSFLKKISNMVVNHGMLVVTTISPIGFVPNLLRRFMSSYLAFKCQNFQEKADILVSAFSTHLDTLSAMTRNKIDWVHDNMINPAYFGIVLTMPRVLEHLGDCFKVLASFPGFAEDWRWFKSFCGNGSQFNEHFLSEYWKKAHNFLDYREPAFVGDSVSNLDLEKTAILLLNAIREHEDNYLNQETTLPLVDKIISLLNDFIALIPSRLEMIKQALREAHQLIQAPELMDIAAVANMPLFRGLFGRETSYLSLMRVNKIFKKEGEGVI